MNHPSHALYHRTHPQIVPKLEDGVVMPAMIHNPDSPLVSIAIMTAIIPMILEVILLEIVTLNRTNDDPRAPVIAKSRIITTPHSVVKLMKMMKKMIRAVLGHMTRVVVWPKVNLMSPQGALKMMAAVVLMTKVMPVVVPDTQLMK